MVAKEWQAALDMIEEHPDQGSEWQYGIELDRIEMHGNPQLWKRLPIHSACVLGAPVGVVEALHLAYPKGVVTKDPFSGALPLHLACRHSAPPDLVKGLVMTYPIGARVADGVGRLALHQACLSGASRLTFTYLLKANPQAVLLKDDKRRTPLQYAKTNPTVKRDTVELLEMVYYFLQKHPAVEDDYKFDGFHSPHRIQQGPIVSGFFEEEESVMGTSQPRADDELKKVVSIGTESSKEEEEEEGKQRSGSDGHLETLTRVGISGILKDRGQSDNIICLNDAPRSVTFFLESTTTADNEVIPWDPILCPALEDEGVDLSLDNVAKESDEKMGGAYLNSEGVQTSAVEDEEIHSTTSSDESLANDGSVADDQVSEADKAAGSDASSSGNASAAADQGTNEASEAAVSISSHDDDDESRSNKNAAESKMSWLEVHLLARVASAHKRADPVESAMADDRSASRDKLVDRPSFSSVGSDQTLWHCNSSKSSPIPVKNEQNGTCINASIQAGMIAHPKLTFPLDIFIAVNQIDKTEMSSDETFKGARSNTSTSVSSESPESYLVQKRNDESIQGESIAHTKDCSALDLGDFISFNQIDKTGLSSDEAAIAASSIASSEASTTDESGLDPKTSASSELPVMAVCLVQERDNHLSPTHSPEQEERMDICSW
jgi:hypothetical protein